MRIVTALQAKPEIDDIRGRIRAYVISFISGF